MAENKNNIYAALCKAQKSFKPAIKDTANPFFKSKYADLASIWDACKDALADNDLFVSQSIANPENGPVLVTKVFHISGEFIESTCPIICGKQNDPQAFGSAVTYTRRYSLAPLLGLITDDDDGEGAMVRPAANAQPKQQKAPQIPFKPATEEQKELYKSILQDDFWNDSRESALEIMNSMDYNKMAQTIAKMQKRQSEAA
jgi:hypothetical protein